ncbi:MAG: GHMP kinase [Gemmataceae bacterium]|nr:GHMP kinase [Gemmataceae bacterium]
MIITQTPLRISFLGGGTDYPEYFEQHGGAVLGTAVDKSAFFSISRFYSKLFDYSIRIAYRKVECVNSLEEVEHAPFRECMRWAGLSQDVEINHSAELPARTGLGSSSSFVVGLLNSIYAFQRKLVPNLELAYQAIDLERHVLKESVGVQDQTFAAVGGFNLIEFRSMGNFIVNRIPFSPSRLDEFEQHLMVFFTGVKRRAEELACKQVQKVPLNLQRLAAMRLLVDEGFTILAGRGPVSAFGETLHKSWMLKRSLDESISNDTVDKLYQAGMEAGALGGKLLGAGGGGFILFFVPPEKRKQVEARLSQYQRVDFRVNASGSHVVHAGSERYVSPTTTLVREAA